MEKSRKSVFYQPLVALADPDYQLFQSKLMPNVELQHILGVRIPNLRKLAKELGKSEPQKVEIFLTDLPHTYYDENNLHGLLISEEKDFTKILARLDEFLPHVDNWATCDIIGPRIFRKYTEELLPHIQRWMQSEHEYTIRFGIEMLMTWYLDDIFQPEYLQWVAAVRHDAYYVRMMIAWFFATALAKQYESTLPILEQKILVPWTHNKAIQKARESRRIMPERKDYLNTLKQK